MYILKRFGALFVRTVTCLFVIAFVMQFAFFASSKTVITAGSSRDNGCLTLSFSASWLCVCVQALNDLVDDAKTTYQATIVPAD